jgi:hypothetical protein
VLLNFSTRLFSVGERDLMYILRAIAFFAHAA